MRLSVLCRVRLDFYNQCIRKSSCSKFGMDWTRKKNWKKNKVRPLLKLKSSFLMNIETTYKSHNYRPTKCLRQLHDKVVHSSPHFDLFYRVIQLKSGKRLGTQIKNALLNEVDFLACMPSCLMPF